jgi:hypothetical protein
VPVHGSLAGRGRRSLRAGLMLLLASTLAHAQTGSPLDIVTVKTGDEVWVTFTQSGTELTRPVALTSSPGPSSVVTIKLERTGPMRTLYITNGFAQPMRCKARVRFRGRAEHMEHEMGPIGAEEENVMTFNNPVEEIVLFEFRLLEN